MNVVTKTSLLVLPAIALGLGGCASHAKARPLAVIVAVRPVNAKPLSTEQVARIHQALDPELLRAGYVLADLTASADLVVTVSFTPTPAGSGGQVKITGIEPTAQFRRATDDGDTPEAKELRRRLSEIERWANRQASSDS